MYHNREEEISEIISQMTLAEKVGQLRQCGPSLVGAFEVSFEELLDMMFDGRISQEEFGKLMSTAEQDFREEDLRAGKIGSYNGVGDAATANRLQKIAVEETRLGIPLLFGYDVIHGFKTITPIPLAESCAWEPELWEKTGRLAAKEATAAGVHMTFAPMVDVSKDARWGRVSEGAGEDVLLNSLYGAAKVRGFQGENLSDKDSMAACVKHFAAYGAGEGGKDYNRVDMSMQRLWEEYLPPYKACIDAGARAVMPAFNDINGIPCSVNGWLLKEILRKQWGFTGMTVSDANAISECVNHGIVPTRREAAKTALTAGMDMDMSSDVYMEELTALINGKEVEEDLLNQAVANILRIKFELGLFEHPYRTDEKREKQTLLTKEHRALAREAAVKSMILLKNDIYENPGTSNLKGTRILPLNAGTKLAVFGELAAERGEMTGAWAIGSNAEDCVSILDACDVRKITYEYTADGSKAEQISKDADVLVVVMGERKDESGEAASKADITVPDGQMKLLEDLVSIGKPIVVVLINGRPLAIPAIHCQVPAILEAWHLGVEAGHAVLDILFGEVNPSGKLTTTFPYSSGQCPIYYAHINTGRPGGKSKFTSKYLDTPLEPVYPFGHGLSYTEYEYTNMQVSKGQDAFQICVTVTNIGSQDGEEIVQCYVKDPVAGRVRPVKQLKAFEKVQIAASEQKEVTFIIPFQELGYYGWNMNYLIEKGEYIFYVGGSSEKVLDVTAEITG